MMSQKLIYFVYIAVILSMPADVLGVTYHYFDNESGNYKWGTAINWDNNMVPSINVTSDVYLGISGNSNIPVIDGSQPAASFQWLCVSFDETPARLSIEAGGQMGVPGCMVWVGGHPWGTNECYGIVNIDGAGSVGYAENWYISGGGGSNPGTGIVNITHGGQMITGGGETYIGTGSSGSGTVNIYEGSMLYGGGSLTIGVHGLIDIRGDADTAKFILNGNQTTLVDDYVADGKIRGFGRVGNVAVTYEEGLDQTVVTVDTVPPCTEYLAADLNLDCYINMKDLAVFAEDWMKCTVNSDPDCL